MFKATLVKMFTFCVLFSLPVIVQADGISIRDHHRNVIMDHFRAVGVPVDSVYLHQGLKQTVRGYVDYAGTSLSFADETSVSYKTTLYLESGNSIECDDVVLMILKAEPSIVNSVRLFGCKL